MHPIGEGAVALKNHKIRALVLLHQLFFFPLQRIQDVSLQKSDYVFASKGKTAFGTDASHCTNVMRHRFFSLPSAF